MVCRKINYRLPVYALFLVLFGLLPSLGNAHGAKGTVRDGGIIVSAVYDSGEPMSYAKVKISAPQAELTFQSGRTDRNGRFCFFPDMAGEWKVIVDDEIGHRLELKVPVTDNWIGKNPGSQAGKSVSSSQ
jgi:nickel transport protein